MIPRVVRDPQPGARDAVVAIGSFDGAHRGHRALLDRVVREMTPAPGLKSTVSRNSPAM